MVRHPSAFDFSPKQFYLLFVVILACVGIADSMMGYVAPIYIEQIGGSATVMGLVLSSSSMAGILCDFLFAKFFPRKNSSFFLLLLFSLVFFFPLSFLLYRTIITSVFGMMMWGIYFEAMVFANFHAIHESVRPSEHGWAWGTASILRNVAWAIGPILASTLHDVDGSLPVRVAIFAYAFALLVAGVYAFLKSKSHVHSYVPEQVLHRSFRQEIAIWRTYGKVIWPLLLLNIIFFCIESAFYSVGPLLGEQLKGIHSLGGVFVSTYSIPGIVMGFLVATLSKPFGKKRLSYLGGILAGTGLMVIGLLPLGMSILVFGFIGSIGLCILYPALCAVFEDFVARSGEFGNDIVGLTAMTGSFSYIIGPILNGILADAFGNQAVFGIWGTILTLYCTLLFFIVKRKVALPQAQAQAVLHMEHVKSI